MEGPTYSHTVKLNAQWSEGVNGMDAWNGCMEWFNQWVQRQSINRN